MPTQLLSQSAAFTGMTALRGSLISMQFLSYLKESTPLCENKPEMISRARIRPGSSKQNPVYAGYSRRSSVFEVERRLPRGRGRRRVSSLSPRREAVDDRSD